jgi:hypothetical protein
MPRQQLQIDELVKHEIAELHEVFVDWYGGRCANDDATFAQRFTARFCDNFSYVLPGGRELSLEILTTGLRKAHGSNPKFRIAIREVRVRFATDDCVVASYHELQRDAINSTPANNMRVSTVLFRRIDGGKLLWTHLHETWLPAEVTAAAAYDF